MGGPEILCRIFKKLLSHVNVAKKVALSPVDSLKCLCRMSLTILRPMSHVEFKKYPCRLSLEYPVACQISRKAPVAVSNLRKAPVAMSYLRKGCVAIVNFMGLDPLYLQ